MSPLRAVRKHPGWSGTVLVLVLAGAAVGAYFAVSSDGTPAAAAATVTRTETVSTGTIRQSVSASGTLAPASDDSLNFSSAGVVTSVAVAEGQTVAKGQKLATINSASLAASVAQAQATVASDEAKVDDDTTNAASSTQLAADKAALAAAENQLASAKTALAGATLTSPINGVVASVNLTVGQSVSGSGSSNGGSNTGSNTGSGANSSTSSSSSTAQVEVISTNQWVVNATVDATSVDLIKVGNQAQLTVTGATDTVYGTISSIAVLSSTSSGTASYPVVIAVTGSPAGLHDGTDVTAALIYKQLTNVVEVSALALHRDTDGTEYVNKLVNGKPVKTTVQVGISSGAETQITSGLADGDQVQVQQAQVTGRTGTNSTTNSTTRNGTTRNFPGGGTFNGGNGGGGGAGFGGFPGGGTRNGN